MNDLIVLETIDQDIAVCIAWANYWNAMAITEVACTRNITRGDGQALTREELKKDALNTATNHLHRASELVDKKKELIYKVYEERQVGKIIDTKV